MTHATCDDIDPVRAWLTAFVTAVRAKDFAAGRRLFAPDVTAFGTVERVCHGVDALEQSQWRDVWPRTSDYCVEPVACEHAGDLAWAAVTWSSTGHANGTPCRRSGRATFVLRCVNGTWLAMHSHHSFDPDPAHRR